jgi:hypothetical protein
LWEKEITERDYLIYRFKEMKSSYSKKSQALKHKGVGVDNTDPMEKITALGEKYAENNRDMVFRIFDISCSDKLDFVSFSKFVKFSWMFMDFNSKVKTGYINDEVIFERKKNYISNIPLYKEEIL